MTVAIIDYGSGNLHSAAKSFQRMSREGAGEDILVTADADAVRRADRIVLPGVGAYADCRAGLDAVPGMVEALEAGTTALLDHHSSPCAIEGSLDAVATAAATVAATTMTTCDAVSRAHRHRRHLTCVRMQRNPFSRPRLL